MTRLAFASAPWIFAAIAALGLWMTWALYLRAPLPVGARARRLLALLASLAWLALAWFGAGPLLQRDPNVYHPPAVVLALDASESHAALGAREAALGPLRAARAHYEALGFRVVEIAFGERAVAGLEAGDGGDARDVGELTSFSALARALDSLQIPNLQAVILASDGRASLGEGAWVSWPAPVHPLRLEVGSGAGARPEAQGERAELDWTRPEEGATLAVTWSASRSARAIQAELREGERTLWTGSLRKEPSTDAGPDWTPTTTEFRLPPSLARGARSSDPEGWSLFVRPAPNPFLQNDRVELRIDGRARAREVFVRPLSSLEERGLIDALRSGDSGGVSAEDPGALKLGAEDVLWTRAGAHAMGVPADGAGARMAYALAQEAPAGSGGAVFGPEARVAWREDGAEFLPASVLRLGDLGVSAEGLRLRAPGRDVEALAWAEQGGRKGLLLWRTPGTRTFGLVLPPLWRASFAPGGGEEIRMAASRWARGASAWARAHGRVRVSLPDPVIAGRPFALEARFPPGDPDYENTRRYELFEGGVLLAAATGRASARFDSVTLRASPSNGRALSLRQGSRIAWTGAARAWDARDLELRELGVDARALAGIAASSNGNIIRNENQSKIPWPSLRGGQARETRARPLPLAPAAFTLAAALLLCAAWALRKRLQLD